MATLFEAALAKLAFYQSEGKIPMEDFNYLPLNLLQSLLSFCLTNRLLNDEKIVVFLRENLKSLDLSKASSFLSDQTLDLISQRCHTMEEINLSRCLGFTERGLKTFFVKMTSLQYINFTLCSNVTDSVVESLSSITRLILARCPQITDSSLTKIIPKCPNLVELNLFSCNRVSNDTLSLVPLATNLQILILARLDRITDAPMPKIIQSCKSLIELNLARCRGITDITIQQIAETGTQIQNLDLTSLTHASETALMRLVRSCTNLHTLYLSYTKNVTDTVICELAAHCTTIQRLYLSRQEVITDRSVCALASSCTMLQILNLSRCKKITDKSLNEIKNCLDMNTLYFSQCSSLTAPALQSVFINCNYIRTLELNGCAAMVTDETLFTLSKHCPNVELLDLTACNLITSVGVETIAGSFPRLISLGLAEIRIKDSDVETLCRGCHNTTLDTLNLSNTSVTGNCLRILQSMKRLIRLYIPRCTNMSITYANQSSSKRKSGWKSLECLFLSGSLTLFDDLLRDVIVGCENLQTLVVPGCLRLTDASLKLIPSLCPNLQTLDISELSGVTDETVLALAKYSKNLICLTLRLCHQITDLSIEMLLKSCFHLHTLILSYCSKVTFKSVSLVNTCPNLQVIALTGTSLSRNEVSRLRASAPHVKVQVSENNNNNNIADLE